MKRLVLLLALFCHSLAAIPQTAPTQTAQEGEEASNPVTQPEGGGISVPPALIGVGALVVIGIFAAVTSETAEPQPAGPSATGTR